LGSKNQLSRKEMLKGQFRPQMIEILRNLDYKEGGAGLLSGKKMYTVLCPKHCQDVFFNEAWVFWNGKKLRLEPGEYKKIK